MTKATLRNNRPKGTIEEMKAREDKGAEMGISRLIMMENAGSAVARFIAEKFKRDTRILVIAGTGNNGGDAFVAARHLSFWIRFKLKLALIGDESKIRMEEARINWNILKRVNKIKKIELRTEADLPALEKDVRDADIIISGIFGTGLHGKPAGIHVAIIKRINLSKATKISVDVPSGMEADSGSYYIGVMSDFSINMYSQKNGMLATPESRIACGKIIIANIGVPV